MVSDNIIYWFAAQFVEWFFLAKQRGFNENERNYGLENLGWFLILLTNIVGLAVLGATDEVVLFLFAVAMMIISIIKLTGNVAD